MWRGRIFLSILSPTSLYVEMLEGVNEAGSAPRKVSISIEDSESAHDTLSRSVSEDILESGLGTGAEMDDVSLPLPPSSLPPSESGMVSSSMTVSAGSAGVSAGVSFED